MLLRSGRMTTNSQRNDSNNNNNKNNNNARHTSTNNNGNNEQIKQSIRFSNFNNRPLQFLWSASHSNQTHSTSHQLIIH